MATNRDLLREAIADAKAVKETAIANAKAALTESFTPFLKEKLSQKISEMEEGYMDEDANENMHADDNNEGLDEISLDELLAELGEDPKTKMEEELYEAKKDEKDEEMSLEDMSEDDLKSFIEDVIKDMVANNELEAGNEEGAEEMEAPEEEEGIRMADYDRRCGCFNHGLAAETSSSRRGRCCEPYCCREGCYRCCKGCASGVCG